MPSLLKKKINFQIIISYLGLFPPFLILLDFSIFNIFLISFLKDFIFFYLLIIFSFIGAIRWNYSNVPNNFEVLFGFIPSLVSTFLIFFYLLDFSINTLLFFIWVFYIVQLIIDFFFYKSNHLEKSFFLNVRLPITLIILTIIFYLILV